jgi:hypothetical protein
MSRFGHVASLGLFLLGSFILASAQVNFNQTLISTDTSAGVVAGDFNHDGILDLVSVDQNSLSFYKGLGGGNYASPINQPLSQSLAQGPIQILAAEFSGHGVLDLALVSNVSGGITILIGNNDGTFKQGKNIDVGGTAQSMTLADFNGDHIPDLAVSFCPAKGACGVKLFLGEGNGEFKLVSTLSVGGGQIVSGDFNADGHQDIMVLGGSGAVLYLGKGNGAFESPLEVALDGVNSLVVGDFFNDRIQSAVALGGSFTPPPAGPDFSAWVYPLRYLDGRLVAGKQQVIEPSIGAPLQVMAAGDLNGDFKDDIFVGGGDVDIALASYLLGNGDGTFQPPSGDISGGAIPVMPFIRDLTGVSRHDVTSTYFFAPGPGDGLNLLINTDAATNCSLPPANELTVHICAPAKGQVVGETFTFKASGSAFNGIAKRMELWIDGKKVAQNLEDQLNATVKLTRGSHVASFVVVDTFDEHVAQPVSFKSEF